MITGDNMDKRMRFLEMEVVRLNNRLASRDEYVSFLESELKSVESEHAEELALKDEFIAGQAETISNLRKEKEDAMEDAADARKELGEARAVILSLQGMIIESNADKNQLEKENEDKQKLADQAETGRSCDQGKDGFQGYRQSASEPHIQYKQRQDQIPEWCHRPERPLDK